MCARGARALCSLCTNPNVAKNKFISLRHIILDCNEPKCAMHVCLLLLLHLLNLKQSKTRVQRKFRFRTKNVSTFSWLPIAKRTHAGLMRLIRPIAWFQCECMHSAIATSTAIKCNQRDHKTTQWEPKNKHFWNFAMVEQLDNNNKITCPVLNVHADDDDDDGDAFSAFSFTFFLP